MNAWPWRKRRLPPEDSDHEIEVLLARIESAFDDEDPDEVEDCLERLEPLIGEPEHQALVGGYYLALGMTPVAIRYLEPIADVDLPDDVAPVRDLALAECALEVGEPERARGYLERLPAEEWQESGKPHWLLGLCHDHLDEPEKADAAFREAERVEPEAFPAPISISPDEAQKIAEHVIDGMPDRIAELIHEVPIVIDDLPPLATIRETRGGIAYDTLGLYTGVSLVDRGAFDPSGPPPMIQIFRRNLERFARDREELEEEIRITLLHELGHHLGLDEDDVDALGLG